VLAVGADQASIDRAQALGFKADPLMNSEASDHTIVRFTVPPGLDAIRGQDLLSKELPGQRFELNRVYRLYRASAREEPVTLDKSLPPTVPGNTPTCAANRCFAREVMGWKDTLSQCARGLKVGVIDTDIDEAHPTFSGRHIHRFDFAPDGRLPAPNWHGTAVLSLLAGSPVTSTPGLIPDADFYAANVFYSDEHGDMAADTISLLKALDWMKKFDVKLINMSFSGPPDALVGDAIARMSDSGVIFVAAAGNEGPTAEPSYPAAYPQVIAVTAVTKDLRNYRYANRGPHIEFSAPGVDIWTAAPGASAGFHSGTSFAAPHVTAVLAVEPPEALQEGKADLLDNLAVMDLGKEGRDPVYGRGLLLAPSECTPPEDVPETAVASAAE
jgi:subtilisin family serine protease